MVNLGNTRDTYFPSVFNVQNEGKWLGFVEILTHQKLPQEQNTLMVFSNVIVKPLHRTNPSKDNIKLTL